LPKDKVNIFWFRRDLRLNDNKGLSEACSSDKKVIPIFIFDTEILSKLKNKKDRRMTFLINSLMELNEKLSKVGSRLYVIHGDPVVEIPKLAKKLKASNIYTNEDYETYSKRRDKKIFLELKKHDIGFNSYKDHVIFRGDEVLKKDRTPYRVFTPYKNEWLKRLGPEDILSYKLNSRILASTKEIPINKIFSLKSIGFEEADSCPGGGEKKARKYFSSFLKRISSYDKNRDLIALDNNSHLSPYLRFGCISTRELVRGVIDANSNGAKVWLSEIIWREFYHMILDQFPHVEKKEFREKYEGIRWKGKSAHLGLWQKGMTGYPLIDAAMRKFKQTGEMHNRVRMIVASFLVKDLLVDWKKGEKYFAENLLDFDLAANNGGWQWCASTGCDAQPYFRIFNPITQSQKFDPDATLIKEYVPELANFPKEYIHFPVKAPLHIQEEAGCLVGKDYPKPIVDHSVQRFKALMMYKDC
jgi:deoxyribodipyrimidine photo-lyase